MKTSVKKQEKPTPVLENIRGYNLTQPWTTKGAGTCKWSFAVKDGQEYFIKQFLTPVWPDESGTVSGAAKKRMIERCNVFEQEKSRLFKAVQASANGNIVYVLDFFRNGTKYHLTTVKINGKGSNPQRIAALPQDKRELFIKVILLSMARLHSNKVVHGDLKPENIMIASADSGNLVPKLIDFGESFLEDGKCFGLTGDVYLSPEAALAMDGEDVAVTCKADVFAMGLLIHQYWTGELPKFSKEYAYACYAVLDNQPLQVLSERLDSHMGLGNAVKAMLDKDPSKRPSIQEVFDFIAGKKTPPSPNPIVPPSPEPKPRPTPGALRWCYFCKDNTIPKPGGMNCSICNKRYLNMSSSSSTSSAPIREEESKYFAPPDLNLL